MRSALFVVLAVTASVALSGCMSNVAIAGQGSLTGTTERTIDCGRDAQLAIGAQGSGSMTITVRDGAGNEVHRSTISGSSQTGEAQSLRGEPGTWTLRVSASGMMGYQGQWGITLTC